MKRGIIITLAAAGAILVAVAAYLVLTAQPTEAPAPVASTSPGANSEQQAIPLSEVAAHNTPSDCWAVINGNVYDLTTYLPRHPGGDDIERACGIDATKLFETKTTDSGESLGSRPHSSAASQQLESLRIGTLAS